MTKQKSLNLDELFGTKDPLVVVFEDKRYELRRPDAWTPDQYARYMANQNALQDLQFEDIETNPATMSLLMVTIGKILSIISPEMSELDLSTQQQSAIINFYAEEVFPQELARAKAKNLTGA